MRTFTTWLPGWQCESGDARMLHAGLKVNEPYFGGDWTKLAHKVRSFCLFSFVALGFPVRNEAHAQGVHMSEQWWRDLFRQCLSGLDYLYLVCQPLHFSRPPTNKMHMLPRVKFALAAGTNVRKCIATSRRVLAFLRQSSAITGSYAGAQPDDQR